MEVRQYMPYGQVFCHWGNCMDLLFLWLALVRFSGIITTILGKTATNTKGAGREIRVRHSKSLPLPLKGERLFFSLKYHQGKSINIYKIQTDMLIFIGFFPFNPGAGQRSKFCALELRTG